MLTNHIWCFLLGGRGEYPCVFSRGYPPRLSCKDLRRW
ncbi:unnamed protein product [Notodromas monacha]|uniref:Uncharacterized protein n=1 Tax=Notodromas monacha TaxID=399045 RepID=A0A7R9BXW5_9CRUS|nr:unnamed protein product [Notodromas monacha]CAG0923388.1 unnamed protein product [Notodromas monacha]